MDAYTLNGIHVATPGQRLTQGSQAEVAKAYMSDQNRTLLYGAVVKEVYRRTNGNITLGPQPDQDLQAIMLNCLDVRLSLKELNMRAFEECVKIVMNNVASYLGYLRHISDKDQHQQNDVTAILRPANTRSFKEAAERMAF